MITDSTLKSKVDALWDKLWAGGLSNPLDAIEQFSFLLFLKRLDEAEQDRERSAKTRKQEYLPVFPDPKLRWSYWTNLKAEEALRHVKEQVFPFIKTLGGEGGSFAEQMENAEFKINKPSLLIEACKMIDQMEVSSQNQDVQGDLYEYLLSKLNTAGTNGQFRTPRHIIRMMVKMVNPQPRERIGDPAAGTCGFLVNAYQHMLETHTRPENLTYDEDGFPHGLIGEKLAKEDLDLVQSKGLTGYDNDSGMAMLRIGSMNLMLHGIERPRFHYADTLSKSFNEEKLYDLVLANPPFKGAIDALDINPTLPTRVKKTEILFLHLFLRLLEMGGRAAVIVPDGVLFGSSNAHADIRRKLIEENRLDGVVSMPSGVFRPYAGVSTAVLVFTRGGTTDRIWFYDMEHDGFSLDDKRQRVAESDIPDVLDCWNHRRDAKFQQKRAQRLADLQKQIAPLKKDRLEHHAIVHRLKFEEVVSKTPDKARAAREKAEAELAELQSRTTPLQAEINQLTRQFWVTKDQVKANKYDLSASRYRQVEQDEEFYEEPKVTLGRMRTLEQSAQSEMTRLRTMLPAAFLKLFGDPKQNPNGWPQQRLSSICSKFSDGPFGSNLKSSHYRSSGVRVVRLQNIGVGEFLDDDKAFVSKEHFAGLQKHSCFPGDVLIGTMGDPNLRACIQPTNIPIALNKADCIQARPDPKHLNALYLQGLLNIPSTLHLVPGMVHGQTRARVSMGELARLPIPVPPLALQQKFAALVERVDRLRAVQREALRQAEHLFASLLHHAFSP